MNEIGSAKVRRLRMEDVIDLERLCIPLEKTVSVNPGSIDAGILSKLEDSGFDQAPVYDRNTKTYFGLIETSYLRSLFESGDAVRTDDPIVRNEEREFHVGSFVTIFDLLGKMTTQRAIVVIHDSDVIEYGQPDLSSDSLQFPT
jgi:CBS domain containing-hemolysin-like protein